jgi:hypothetical protein
MVTALLEATTTYLAAPASVFWVTVAGSERLRPMERLGAAAGASLGELPGGAGIAGAASRAHGAVLWPAGDDLQPSPMEPDVGAGAMAIPVRSGGHPFGVLGY